MFRLLRPRQWTKNLLLFAALVFARELFDADQVLLATLGFVAFCLASSSVYVINDVLDVERDRNHPEKCKRPIASGDVSPTQAVILAGALTVAALAIAYWIGPEFTGAVVIYIGMTHFYSLMGKNIVILDVLLIAFGFVIRAIAGAFSIVLEQYTENSLNTFIASTMAATLISYGLYVLDVQKQASDDVRLLMATFPIVVFGVFRFHHLAETTRMGDKPEEVLLRDRPIQVCAILFALVATAAIYHMG